MLNKKRLGKGISDIMVDLGEQMGQRKLQKQKNKTIKNLNREADRNRRKSFYYPWYIVLTGLFSKKPKLWYKRKWERQHSLALAAGRKAVKKILKGV